MSLPIADGIRMIVLWTRSHFDAETSAADVLVMLPVPAIQVMDRVLALKQSRCSHRTSEHTSLHMRHTFTEGALLSRASCRQQAAGGQQVVCCA